MYTEDDYGQARQPAPRRNAMAKASFILGIAALMFCSFIYIALPCGSMAILCAILSRTESKMAQRCRIAIVCGCIAITMSLVFTGAAVHRVMTDPQMRAYLEYMLQTYTGDPDLTLDGFLEELLPFRNDTPDRDDSGEDEWIRMQVGDTEAEEDSELAGDAETEEKTSPSGETGTENDSAKPGDTDAENDSALPGDTDAEDGSAKPGDNSAGEDSSSPDGSEQSAGDTPDDGKGQSGDTEQNGDSLDNGADSNGRAGQEENGKRDGGTERDGAGQDNGADRNENPEKDNPSGDGPHLGIQKGEKLFL